MTSEIDLLRVLCALDQLADPGAHGFSLGAGDWPLSGFVIRRGMLVRAFVNRCPHAGHPLNWLPHQFLAPGDAAIVCASHGALFDLDGGVCLAGPCAGRGLRELPISVRDGYVMLAADPDDLSVRNG